jgi:hypothetical protein
LLSSFVIFPLITFFVGSSNGVEKESHGAAGAALCFVEVEDRGEGAQFGVGSDLLYDFGFVGLTRVAAAGVGFGFGEVEAGDLEAVEEQAGSAGVDLVGGDAPEDAADGVLDGAAVFGEREVKGGSAALAFAGVGDGFAGGVVVVAELFSAEAWASAAGAVGEDVAALVAFWLCCVVHVCPSPRGTCLVQSLGKAGVRSGPDLFPLCRLNAEARLFGRASFVFSLLFLFYEIGHN